ncbi:hypothetical protein Ccrd_009083, partial [Cynara cardunculus var. scolymus]
SQVVIINPSFTIPSTAHACSGATAIKFVSVYSVVNLVIDDFITELKRRIDDVMYIGLSGLILNPWRLCIATVACMSSPYSINAIPGFASTILTSLNPWYCLNNICNIIDDV